MKKICAVKDTLYQCVSENSYLIKETYKALLDPCIKVWWKSLVWNRLSIPKIRFICCLVTIQRMKTKDQLMKFGVVDNELCPLCGSHTETVKHLFFKCVFNVMIVIEVRNWLGIKLCSIEHMDFRKFKASKMQRHVFCAIYSAVIYHIWKNRNILLLISNLTLSFVSKAYILIVQTVGF